jgi:hypothetical protein
VAKNARSLIVVALVAMLAILVVQSGYPLVGAGVFALGIIGLLAVRERDVEEAPGDDAQAKLDRAIETGPTVAEPTPTAAPPVLPARGTSGGLPTWQPAAPPAFPEPDFGPSANAPTAFAPQPAPAPAPPPAAHPSTGSNWDSWTNTDRGPVSPTYDTHNPLADLDRLDEIDPVAEVERLDRLGPAAPPAQPFSFSSAPSPINESAINTDDDIMAASQATELQVADGADSELARLLAKVQQRLAAYE